MNKVTLINITNVNDGETPLVRLDDLTGDLIIGKDTWKVVSASKFEELNKKVKGNIQKIDLTDEAYKKLTEVVNGNKIELDKKLSTEINDVYASLKGRSQNYSYNSSVEPQGQSNAKPIDELLKLAGEAPSSDYHDVYRIWKGQITESNPWKKVIEKHQGDIFNDMKTGNYYRFVYDEEKGTAFWLKGSNTAVSDLISRLTVEGELITSTKLNEMLAASVEFQQFKVVDNSKKKEIDKRLTELANEAQNMGNLVSGHSTNLSKLNEFVKDPSVNGKSLIHLIDEVNQKTIDTGKEFGEFKERQKEVNINFTKEVNEAKTTSKSDLEAESARLAEFIKNAQETGNSALEALGNYKSVNDSKVQEVEKERAELEKKLNEFKNSSTVSLKEVSEQNKSLAFDLNTYKDANRRTIQGLDTKVETVKKEAKEEITKVKKDISAITTNIIRKGTLRNGKVIGGIGGKVRLEMQVFYGTKDVTSIANDNECISWQLNDDYSRTSLGKIYDIDGATIMATDEQQVNVAGYLDKEKLLAIISPGYNVYAKTNFSYRNNEFITSEEEPTVTLVLYKDGIEVVDENIQYSYTYEGAGNSKKQKDTAQLPFWKGYKRDGTPLIIDGTVTYNSQVVEFKQVIEQMGGVIYEVKFEEEITRNKDGEFVYNLATNHIYLYGDGKKVEGCTYDLQWGHVGWSKMELADGNGLCYKGKFEDKFEVSGQITLPDNSIFEVLKVFNLGGGKMIRPNIRSFDDMAQISNNYNEFDFKVIKDTEQRSFTYVVTDRGLKKEISPYDKIFNPENKKIIVSFNIAFINFDIEKIYEPADLKKFGDRYYYVTNDKRTLQMYARDLQTGDKLIIDEIKFEYVKEGEPEEPTDFCLSIEDIAKINEELAQEQ